MKLFINSALLYLGVVTIASGFNAPGKIEQILSICIGGVLLGAYNALTAKE